MNRELQITLLGKRQAYFSYPQILPKSLPKKILPNYTCYKNMGQGPFSCFLTQFDWAKNCISFWCYVNFSDPSIWALVFTDTCWPTVFLPLCIFCLYPLPILSIKLMGLLNFFVCFGFFSVFHLPFHVVYIGTNVFSYKND